ncbi:chemotaxis protein CheB [Flavitalea sp.]|nr:chemotaxis protein CheB [Flavitalea sp.]
MKLRNIIVVGASAGGVPALIELVTTLPKNFEGSIFVVLHIPATSPSNLPEILSRGALPAKHPKDGDQIKPGVIYIAPPDHHLLLEEDKVMVKRGPKENRFRPSIDALFRSAAYVYGTRVIGIVLSGVLNDGTSGLWSIKRLGGLTVIQDPAEAQHPEMPLNVLEYVSVDFQLSIKKIGQLIDRTSRKVAPNKKVVPKKQLKLIELEIEIAIKDNAFEMGIMDMGELTPFTCPECNGVLIQIVEGRLIRFRCHTGHAYTASALMADLSESVEDKLWQCMRGLEETTMLLNKVALHFQNIGQKEAAHLFLEKSENTAKRARIIHDSIFQQAVLSEDIRYEAQKPRRSPAKHKTKSTSKAQR